MQTHSDISENYGPCSNCRYWLLLKTVVRHQTTCSAKVPSQNLTAPAPSTAKEKAPEEKKRALIAKSSLLSGQIASTPSKHLVDEVFSIMTRDEIGRIAQGDYIITQLGESWLRRSVDNKLKRKNYVY